MLVWLTTIILVLTALGGWVFLKRNHERYIHNATSPINFFFRWGTRGHHFFKVAIIILFMTAIFSFYKYLLGASEFFALTAAVIAGIVLAGGKELMDYYITLDDVVVSIIGIGLGFFALRFLF